MFLSKAEVELTGSSSWEEVVLCGGAVFSVEKPAHFQSSHPTPQRKTDPCTMPGLYTLISYYSTVSSLGYQFLDVKDLLRFIIVLSMSRPWQELDEYL